jgi:O-antigen/teichoic acid export membrane protein
MTRQNIGDAAPAPDKTNLLNRHLRGSTVLLVGRLLPLCMTLAAQIITVRYLTKQDYGAFAYAIFLVEFASMLAAFGMDKAISRWIPVYEEKGQQKEVLGTLVLAFVVVGGIGLLASGSVFAIRHHLGSWLGLSERDAYVLLVMSMLVPIYAVDSVLLAVFTIFSSVRALFLRRHLLGPGLKLLATLVVVGLGLSVPALAWSYVVAGILVILIGSALLLSEGLLKRIDFGGLRLPIREALGFSLPLFGVDLGFLLRGSLIVILVEQFSSASGVAEYRAVLPFSRLNELVIVSFSFLFTPLASRALAREKHKELADLYGQSAIWIAVFTFPIFAVTFCLAEPLVVFLLGAEYRNSAILLAVLSFGYYVHATFGLNSRMLNVVGKVRPLLIADLAVTVASIAASWWLISRQGALGGAISFALTLLMHAFVKKALLQRYASVRLFGRDRMRAYYVIIAATLALYVFQHTFAPPLLLGLLLAAILSLVVVWLSRQQLDVESVFPELQRLPLARWLFPPAKNS